MTAKIVRLKKPSKKTSVKIVSTPKGKVARVTVKRKPAKRTATESGSKSAPKNRSTARAANGNGSKLRFTSVEIKNWKNFASAKADLQGRVFAVGPNASGKSNLLDVFLFLSELAAEVGGGLQAAIQKRGGMKKIRALAARQNTGVSLAVTVGDDENPDQWRYELEFNQTEKATPSIIAERIIRNGTVRLKRPDSEDKRDKKRLTQTRIEQVFANKEYRGLVDFLQSVEHKHFVPQVLRNPDAFMGLGKFACGGDLLDVMAAMPKKTRDARLRKIGKALSAVVPQLGELQWNRDGTTGKSHLRSRYSHWRPQGAWQEEDQFSDGTLRLIGFLWTLLDTDKGPLLLEEPELSLHPEVVRYLPELFHQFQKKSMRQVIVSTHSPDLLTDSGVGLDEVLLLEPTNEGTSITEAGKYKDVVALLNGGATLADAVIPRTKPKTADQLPLWND